MSRHPNELPYHKRRNPRLPWGYWMVIDAYGDPDLPLVDEDGTRWESLRSALWCGRLGMGGGVFRYAEEQQEFLLSVLVAIDRTVDSDSEAAKDLFDGDWNKAAHYGMWLEGHGLIEEGIRLSNATLTPEGRAIMAMLMATRDPALMAKPIGLRSLATYAAMRPEPE